jgi:hypothetical protein
MHTKQKVSGNYNKITWQALFRSSLNSTLRSKENAEKVPQAFLGKKADSLGNFSGKISNLVGILLWIIVLLNLIITFLIYKIIS